MPPSQSKYCVRTGRSSPSSSRRWLTLSSVASLPRIAVAGSLGSACVMAKTMIETTNSVNTPNSNRFRMNLMTPRLFDNCASSLLEVEVLVAAPVVVEVECVGALDQSLQTQVEPIQLVLEERDDQTAGLVELGLHLVGDHLALLEIDLGDGGVVVLDERRSFGRPVRIGVGGGRQFAGGDLRQEPAGAPEVGGERALEVLVAPVHAAVEGLWIDRDAGFRRHRRERLDHLRQTGRVVRGEQVDLHAGHAGLLQQGHRGRDVLLTLRQLIADVRRVERAE